jgi:hypothetical protein
LGTESGQPAFDRIVESELAFANELEGEVATKVFVTLPMRKRSSPRAPPFRRMPL